MSEVKDYSNNPGANSHYNGVPSMYGRLVAEQQKQQPKYRDEPGMYGGGVKGEHTNKQKGPSV